MDTKMHEVESDLPKITGKDYQSPVEFELEIQRQRVLYILHLALKKTQIMAHLPCMLRDDCKVLKLFLTSSELDFVRYSCSKYMPGGLLESLKNEENVLKYSKVLNAISLHRSKDEEQDRALFEQAGDNPQVDYEISQMVEIIINNENLVKYLENCTEEIAEPVLNLIDCLRHLKKLIYEKLMITSREQMDNDKKLRVAFKSNFDITENIKRLEAQINKQQKELGVELEKKQAILESYNTKLSDLQEEFKEEMMKHIQKSEKQMMNDSFASEARQVELEREAQEAAAQYANLLDTDLADESQLRQKRNKMEAQLASWLTKYDNDVGEKQTEFEALEKEFNKVKGEYEDLTEMFNDQTEEYEKLMAEKQEEEQRMFEEMAIEFLRNRSARTIQRAWRAYWQRKLERRKARRTGKGKEKKKAKKEEPRLNRKADPNAVLQKSFKKKDYLFEELDTTKEFSTEPVKVDLTA